MWANRKNHAVSEIVGTVMLLGMAIAMFSLVQIFAFGLLAENPNAPSVRLVASVDDKNITIAHIGGESLSLDTKILCVIYDTSSTSSSSTIADNNLDSSEKSDGLWGISENVEYNPGEGPLDDKKVAITVVDVKSNSVIMMATIQG